jgi:hypothetical protein
MELLVGINEIDLDSRRDGELGQAIPATQPVILTVIADLDVVLPRDFQDAILVESLDAANVGYLFEVPEPAIMHTVVTPIPPALRTPKLFSGHVRPIASGPDFSLDTHG